MKKFARVLALMLIATMLCLTLVACAGKPNEDPEEAKTALKLAGYEVDLDDDVPSWITLGLGYDCEGLTAHLTAKRWPNTESLDEDDWKNMDGKTFTFDCIEVLYFKTEEDARNAFSVVENELNRIMEKTEDNLHIEETTERIAEMYDVEVEIVFDWQEATLDGCMIYVGTSGALKDAA